MIITITINYFSNSIMGINHTLVLKYSKLNNLKNIQLMIIFYFRSIISKFKILFLKSLDGKTICLYLHFKFKSIKFTIKNIVLNKYKLNYIICPS